MAERRETGGGEMGGGAAEQGGSVGQFDGEAAEERTEAVDVERSCDLV